MSSSRKRRSLLGRSAGGDAGDEPEPERPEAPAAPAQPFTDSLKQPSDAAETAQTEEITQSGDALDAPPPMSAPPMSHGRTPETALPVTAAPASESPVSRPKPMADDEVFDPSAVTYQEVSPASGGDVVIGVSGEGSPEGLGPPSLITSERSVSEAGYTASGQASLDSTDASWGTSIPSMAAPVRPGMETEPLVSRTGAARSRLRTRGDDPLEDNPPTEEIPIGAGLGELSPPIGAPIGVPEPPAIAGILDRFTPASVNRTEVGSRHTAGRPKYLADEPVVEETPKPAPKAQKSARPKDEDDEPPERNGPGPLVLIGGSILVVSVLAIGIGGGIVWFTSPGPSTSVPGLGEEGPHTRDGIKVRGDMKAPPPVFGTSDGGAGTAPDPSSISAPLPSPPSPSPSPSPSPVAPVVPTPAPAPVAAPAPAPAPVAPRPAPPPRPAVESTGTLRIKSNRRVLVYVNGSPVGYAPTEYKGKPGSYTVSAMVPGQPDTKQTRDAKIDAGGSTQDVNFTF